MTFEDVLWNYGWRLLRKIMIKTIENSIYWFVDRISIIIKYKKYTLDDVWRCYFKLFQTLDDIYDY